jgi:hypothetical protein
MIRSTMFAALLAAFLAEPIFLNAAAQSLQSANDTRYDTHSDFVLQLMLGGGGPLERDPLTDYPTSKAPGVIVAGPKLMSAIRGVGPGLIFFTARAHPLTRLAEVSETEIASWAVPALFDVKTLLLFQYLLGGEPRNAHMIGNLNFPKLFLIHPELRLFITSAKIGLVDAIEREGGGMKITFVEPVASRSKTRP